MPASNSFSESVDGLLLLHPHGQSESCYPAHLDHDATRFNDGETVQEWFVRLVNAACGGDPRRCAIEPNIAVFATLYWNRKTLVGANICTLVTSCELEAYYVERPADCNEMYLRLDLDIHTLGEPFSHPLPHIHVLGEFSPRFSLDGGNSGNVVMDYFEFLYRNFASTKWNEWAERVWNKHYFELPNADRAQNPFPRILAAFKESQIGILRQQRDNVVRLKELLRHRKDNLFQFGMNADDRELLEYPQSR